MKNIISVDFDPTEDEAKFVAQHLIARQKTISDAFKFSPAYEIMCSAELSRFVAIIKVDTLPIALMGVADFLEDENTGLVWAMLTPDVEKYKIGFSKCIKEVIENTCCFYSNLVSFVHVDDEKSQAFNEFLGFYYSGYVYSDKNKKQSFYRFEKQTTTGLTLAYGASNE